jgi:hypothetical protein
MPECEYNGCDNPQEIVRQTLSGHVMAYCPNHDPWMDETVSECFTASKVGP